MLSSVVDLALGSVMRITHACYMSDLVEDAYDTLFELAIRDRHHILYHIFPDRKTKLKYDSRQRRHEVTFLKKRTIGILQFHYPTIYKDCY